MSIPRPLPSLTSPRRPVSAATRSSRSASASRPSSPTGPSSSAAVSAARAIRRRRPRARRVAECSIPRGSVDEKSAPHSLPLRLHPRRAPPSPSPREGPPPTRRSRRVSAVSRSSLVVRTASSPRRERPGDVFSGACAQPWTCTSSPRPREGCLPRSTEAPGASSSSASSSSASSSSSVSYRFTAPDGGFVEGAALARAGFEGGPPTRAPRRRRRAGARI